MCGLQKRSEYRFVTQAVEPGGRRWSRISNTDVLLRWTILTLRDIVQLWMSASEVEYQCRPTTGFYDITGIVNLANGNAPKPLSHVAAHGEHMTGGLGDTVVQTKRKAAVQSFQCAVLYDVLCSHVLRLRLHRCPAG